MRDCKNCKSSGAFRICSTRCCDAHIGSGKINPGRARIGARRTQRKENDMKLLKRILNAYIDTAGRYPMPMAWMV